MYCRNCGKELVDGLDECPFCHCKVDLDIKARNGRTYTNSNENNSMYSTASLLSAIVSFFVFPYILGIVAIILGIIGVAKREAKSNQALIGIILAIISIIWAYYYFYSNFLSMWNHLY